MSGAVRQIDPLRYGDVRARLACMVECDHAILGNVLVEQDAAIKGAKRRAAATACPDRGESGFTKGSEGASLTHYSPEGWAMRGPYRLAERGYRPRRPELARSESIRPRSEPGGQQSLGEEHRRDRARRLKKYAAGHRSILIWCNG